MISRGLLLQRSASLANKPLNSRFHSAPRQWFESLFAAPKGFGRFYPPGAGGKTAGNLTDNFERMFSSVIFEKKWKICNQNVRLIKGEAGAKAGKSAGEKAGKGAGGGGGGNGDFPPENQLIKTVMISAALAGALLYSGVEPNRQGREISWQEFSGQLLESGQVDRILITNKTSARYESLQ